MRYKCEANIGKNNFLYRISLKDIFVLTSQQKMELVTIQKKIYEIRGHKVMLDFDLAELYEVEVKRLKEAVRRNMKRFPDDFMFELNYKEFTNLRSQIASLNTGVWGAG
jgi:hypothetical protein